MLSSKTKIYICNDLSAEFHTNIWLSCASREVFNWWQWNAYDRKNSLQLQCLWYYRMPLIFQYFFIIAWIPMIAMRLERNDMEKRYHSIFLTTHCLVTMRSVFRAPIIFKIWFAMHFVILNTIRKAHQFKNFKIWCDTIKKYSNLGSEY